MSNKFDPAAWIASLTPEQKLFLASRYEAGRSDGFAAGTEKANRQIRMNKILLPVAVFAPFVGLLVQRYFIGC